MMTERLNVGELAPRALEQACHLASVAKIGESASSIQTELLSWWKDNGEDLLFPANCTEWPEDSDEEDNDEEEELPGNPPADDQVELKDLSDAVQESKQIALIQEEIHKFESDQDFCGADPSTAGEPQSEPEDETAAPAHSELDPKKIKTLEDILTAAGLMNFEALDKDHESKMLQCCVKFEVLDVQLMDVSSFSDLGDQYSSRSAVR